MIDWSQEGLEEHLRILQQELLLPELVYLLRNRASPILSAAEIISDTVEKDGEIDPEFLKSLLLTIQTSSMKILTLGEALLEHQNYLTNKSLPENQK